MKNLSYFFGIVVSLAVVFLLLIAVLVIENDSFIEIDKPMSHADVKRIKSIIKKHNPLKFRFPRTENLTLIERDLNMLINFGLKRFVANAVVYTKLKAGLVKANISFELPSSLLGRYINVALDVEIDQTVSLKHLKIGLIELPDVVSQFLLDYSHQYLLENSAEYEIVNDAIKNVEIDKAQVRIAYVWKPQMYIHLRHKGSDLLIPSDLRERLRVYNNRLAKVVRPLKRKPHSVLLLLRPLFELAAERSKKTGNAVAENRALLLTLGSYVARSNLLRLLSQKKNEKWIWPRHRKFTLNQRGDLAQHYFVSAALSVSAGVGIADAVGLAKELDDSMGGSGFSFADLLADRVGVSFAQLAIKDEKNARLLQNKMLSSETDEAHLMPPYAKLPEGLSEQQFKQEYRHVGSVTYKLIEQDMENRISKLKIFNP